MLSVTVERGIPIMLKQPQQHFVFIIMGVSGSGKSVIAKKIAQRMNVAFLDGDFLHPRRNILKMADGHPLNDEDRQPWLAALNDAIFAMQRTQKISLLVCSALKQSYRDCLRQGNPNLRFIYLAGDKSTIEKRLKSRKGHFFKPEMLATQFTSLEEPGPDERDVIRIQVDQPLDAVLKEALTTIRQVSQHPDNISKILTV